MFDALALQDLLLAMQVPAGEESVVPDSQSRRPIWFYVRQGVLFAFFCVLIRFVAFPAAKAVRSRFFR